MAIQTPGSTTSGPTSTADPTPEMELRRLVDAAGDAPSDVTASRAVRPPVVVRNRRLVAGGVGESFLVWRCLDCGTVGSLDALPTRCVCGARRESLAYVTED
jgi:rubrerythrin